MIVADRPMDDIDCKLIALLQDDATLSVAQMADRVALSPTPCWRRIQKLEATGVIPPPRGAGRSRVDQHGPIRVRRGRSRRECAGMAGTILQNPRRHARGDGNLPHGRRGIPRSRDNPEVCWVNDTEIVGDLVAISAPALWHAVAQEVQHCAAKIRERGVAFVVGDLSVHQPP